MSSNKLFGHNRYHTAKRDYRIGHLASTIVALFVCDTLYVYMLFGIFRNQLITDYVRQDHSNDFSQKTHMRRKMGALPEKNP